MFRPGRVFKVKVEMSPDLIGFGRATILECDKNRLYVRIRSSRTETKPLPKGTRIWFVGNSADNRFNGLWATEVLGTRKIGGVTALECRTPKFQPQAQQRRHRRAAFKTPVELKDDRIPSKTRTMSRDISRSGLGFSVFDQCAQLFTPGEVIEIELKTATDDIPLKATIISSRYNWLLNRTDVGVEFVDLNPDTVQALDRLLVWLGSTPRQSDLSLSDTSGSLSRWLKSGKEDKSFLASGAARSGQEINEEEKEEEDDDDEEDEDGEDDDRDDYPRSNYKVPGGKI